MRTLYHHPICPLSKQLRVVLHELDLECSYVIEEYWRRDKSFVKLNPAAELPILVEHSQLILCGTYPAIEYILEKYQPLMLMPEEVDYKAEVRRMMYWFNNKFYKEVTNYIVQEKIIRPMQTNEAPRTDLLRAAKINLKYHLRYITSLIEQRGYIGGDMFSVADIVAACHISILDYFNEIFWDQYVALKEWYLIIKSRPSFRPILNDTFRGIGPSQQYKALDF